MSEIAKFVSSDGVEHTVEVDSVAFGVMTKDGSFTRVYSEAEAAEQNPGSDAAAPAPPTRAELAERAKELGVPVKGKNAELLAAIEEAEAAKAKAETETETK